MVDLDSDPTKILEVVEIGKQLLITRGSLTTFSIANDIAKYFAIIPAMFMMAIPQLGVLNIMDLATPHSAILSALIFNAIIIPCLIPLAQGRKVPPDVIRQDACPEYDALRPGRRARSLRRHQAHRYAHPSAFGALGLLRRNMHGRE